MAAVILEPKKIKSVTVAIVFPSICHEVMGPDAMILVFGMSSFKPAFSLSSFTFSRGPLDLLLSLPLEWYHPYESEVAISPSTLDSILGFI